MLSRRRGRHRRRFPPRDAGPAVGRDGGHSGGWRGRHGRERARCLAAENGRLDRADRRDLNRNLALVAAFCRLVFALMWGVTALNTLGALRLLGDAAYLPVFEADQLQTLARLHIAASFDAYYVGLPFWGLASTVCSYLWFKSRYIPRALAAFGVISSAWCVICAFAFIVFPHFDTTVNASWFDLPMVIFEMALGLWLLFKGLSAEIMK
ncbi:MAG TPA: hypothetical protein DHU55_14195 [Blastocatellia bacterium]|nr:hypothetical protein [Blastocatellia bacterium]HAF22208.1 hypothetical protein [Blastocatellia bacterium]HCX30898.1 hypothetical protein [Blastocatellia bacterium]